MMDDKSSIISDESCTRFMVTTARSASPHADASDAYVSPFSASVVAISFSKTASLIVPTAPGERAGQGAAGSSVRVRYRYVPSDSYEIHFSSHRSTVSFATTIDRKSSSSAF